MSPEKQRIAIAEACGWTEVKNLFSLDLYGNLNRNGGLKSNQDHPVGLRPGSGIDHPSLKNRDGSIDYPHQSWWESTPDYLNDLNAMHGSERGLTEDQCYLFQDALCLITGAWNASKGAQNWLWHATASQRAEAFLRAIGKWE